MHVSCSATEDDGCTLLPRKVTVLTLNHDMLCVVLNDWVCSRCGYENRYTGEAHGLYPAAKCRAFTVELMYFFMHECMNEGISFRAMFDLIFNVKKTASYLRKIETKKLDALAPEFRRDRRLSNDAVRIFCEHIDLSDEALCTETLFSCSHCEVELSRGDCQQLGIRKEQFIGAKSFSALVMDGKVIGALRDFPVDRSNVDTLVSAEGLPSKLMSNRATRGALRFVTTGLRRSIRAVEYGRGNEVVHNICEVDGKVYFRLGSLLDLKGVTKANYEQVMKVGRWFCSRASYLCSGSKWTSSCTSEHKDCAKEHKEMSEHGGCAIENRVLRKLFVLGGDRSCGNAFQLKRDVQIRNRAYDRDPHPTTTDHHEANGLSLDDEEEIEEDDDDEDEMDNCTAVE